MIKLQQAIQYVEKQTGYEIIYKGGGPGKLLKGTTKSGKKLAYIFGDNPTQVSHELGHLLATPGPAPSSKKANVIREMEAWRASEALMNKFDIHFDEDCFDEGMGSYIMDLLLSKECPNYQWVSQFIGE